MSQRIYDFRKAIGDDMKNPLETNIFRFSALYGYIYKGKEKPCKSEFLDSDPKAVIIADYIKNKKDCIR